MGTKVAPILHWKGENNAIDSIAGLVATWGITEAYTTGKVGRCFDINSEGIRESLSVNNNALFNFSPTGSFSVRFWLKAQSGGSIILVSKQNDLLDAGYDFYLQLDFGGGLANIRLYTPGATLVGETGNIEGIGTFQQYLWTYSNGMHRFYIDDLDVWGEARGPYLIGNTNRKLQLFGCSTGGAPASTCQPDEIRFYDQVITADNDDDGPDPTGDSLEDLAGHPIFTQKPDWSNLPRVGIGFGREILQLNLGRGRVRSLTDDLSRRLTYGFTEATKAEEFYLLNFFCSRKGRNERFWLPAWYQSFKLTAAITAGEYTFTCADYHFDEVARYYERVFLYLSDGSLITREVINSYSSTEFVVNTAFDRDIDPEEVVVFGRLLLGRFDQDELEVKHITDKVSDIRFNFIELAKEYSLGVTES